jgi:uncharacterized membrane protein HdeD (DUF308 family)
MVDLRPERRGWRLSLGIAMVVLGVLALFSAPAAGVVSAVLLGLALVTAGGVALFSIFRSESTAERLMMVCLAGMLLFTGIALLSDPVRALVSVTTLLATFLVLSGVARIVIALFDRRGHWGRAILHGVVNLLLGVLIFAQWPLSGLVAIGLIIAIELIVVGASWIFREPATPAPTPDRRARHGSRHKRSRHAARHS